MIMVDPEVEELFKDAESLYRESLKDLEAKRIRKAAENAWAATVRATEALLVARGREYEKIRWPRERRYELDALSVEDKTIEDLRIPERYGSRETFLHGSCFYEGACEPISTERRIRETIDYIKDAKRIVYGKDK
ncbi:MAG: hypothetical protein AOA65_0831 [Candidatus Bathyarchaeota archaeon BA1]|nr:MAG: hypothetical protein AOA65_0831 [Candidatus Bathyarchaeota archaeon BA1]